MRSRYLTPLGLSLLLLSAACGSTGGTPEGSGGSSASGGSGSGGSHSSGGSSASGGSTASGGKVGSGGTTSSGGATGSGGATASGGKVGSGGTTSSGGATGTSSGGATVTSSGGAGPSGGSSGSAGKMGSGGATTGSGGGGGTAPVGMSGLPVPATTNVAQPTGSGTTVTVVPWAGFTAAVTYSFDDSNQTQIDNYAALQAAGGQYTFFMWTGHTPMSMNAIWKQALKDGHEIGDHTMSHDSNGHCTAADIKAGADFITSNLGVAPLTFAAPNGSSCFEQPAGMYFFINRGVSPANPVLPTDSADPLNLNCYIPNQGQQTATFNANIDDGKKKGGWVIYVIHGFSTSDMSYQPVDIGQVTAAIKYSKGMPDMWVGSMVNVGAYWQGQKAFTAAMTATANGDKTWTWKLPAHFPTGHYLRVKTDGGTLKQNGATIPWDSHGYYEISLDALSVTLSPS